MNVLSAFPSKYLRAADLPPGARVQVLMENVSIENVTGGTDPDDDRPVLHFVGKSKGLVLNKTNASTIAGMYGPDSDAWAGMPIVIYATETSFGGKMVPCIRVAIARTATAAQGGKAAPAPTMARPADQPFTADEIPF